MERCPSCNAEINPNSNFCFECGANLKNPQTNVKIETTAGRKYKLRSPILESDILYEESANKKYAILGILSYGFWLFGIIFVFYGINLIYSTYSTALFKGIVDASFMFMVALLCFILPGFVHLFVDLEENLTTLVKELKKEK